MEHDRPLFKGWAFKNYLYKPFMKLTREWESVRVLDHGCGKAVYLHDEGIIGPTLYRQMNGRLQTWYCYDPGYDRFDKYPIDRKFDAVICCDVLEHVPINQLDRVILNIRESLEEDGVAFFNIGGNRSHISFADGENTHITIQPAEFWCKKMKLLRRQFYLRHVGDGIIKTYKAI